MLSQITTLIKGYAQDVINSNSQIASDQKKSVVDTATNALKGGLVDNISGLTSLLSGNIGGGNDSLVTTVQNKVSGELVGKLGLDSGVSTTIASTLVPMVLKGISNKVSSGNWNLGSLITSLEKSSSGEGILGKLASFFGK